MLFEVNRTDILAAIEHDLVKESLPPKLSARLQAFVDVPQLHPKEVLGFSFAAGTLSKWSRRTLVHFSPKNAQRCDFETHSSSAYQSSAFPCFRSQYCTQASVSSS